MEQATDKDKSDEEKKPAISVWGVRYQVKEVERSIAFYTQQLGCQTRTAIRVGLCQCREWRTYCFAQRSGQLGFPPDARRAPTRAGWMESDRPQSG
jgi:hypothetical protein